jgi:hypothetical protein
MTSQPSEQTSREVLTHLRRLSRAVSAVDIVRELQSLTPSLGPNPMLADLPLSALTALAEAHLRDRLDPARDAQTGLLETEAFFELWHAHARHVSTLEGDRTADAVCLSVCCLSDGCERRAPALLKLLAAACIESVAADDYVGRMAATSLAVLPRNGGLRGARSVAARLLQVGRDALAEAGSRVRLEVTLRDLVGGVRERSLWSTADGPSSGLACALCHAP